MDDNLHPQMELSKYFNFQKQSNNNMRASPHFYEEMVNRLFSMSEANNIQFQSQQLNISQRLENNRSVNRFCNFDETIFTVQNQQAPFDFQLSLQNETNIAAPGGSINPFAMGTDEIYWNELNQAIDKSLEFLQQEQLHIGKK